ncbi:hypothetical protein FOA52_004650 [Chlamydomonas sp. UWO 241]|nr:hypothetical protein FOA52_004650 [Chlamydomonas sp. UWO 241]
MGYTGAAAGRILPPGKRSPLEEALGRITSLDSLEVLGKLTYNPVVQKDAKFRRLKLSNPKIDAVIVQVPGCLEALQEMGWEADAEDAEFLVVAPGKITMAEVRKIEDAKDRLRATQARRDRPSAAAAATTTAAVTTEVVLRVEMPCSGCSDAVTRVLGKMEGVESFDVSLEEQKVTVRGNVTPQAVLEKVAKTGKKCSIWE